MYKILVCDDDREIVEAIEIYLSQEGYQILKAYDGIEALEILEKLFTQHEVVILTGGSMMYVDAICKGIDDIPAVDAEPRQIMLQ